jgi:hypothetical protein
MATLLERIERIVQDLTRLQTLPAPFLDQSPWDLGNAWH